MISICISCLFELSLLLHKLGSVLSRQPRWDEKRPREVKQLAQRHTVNLYVCVVVEWVGRSAVWAQVSSWLLSRLLLWGASKILSGKWICWTLGSLSSSEWPWSLCLNVLLKKMVPSACPVCKWCCYTPRGYVRPSWELSLDGKSSGRSNSHPRCFFFFFFPQYFSACGILVPRPGIEPSPFYSWSTES